MLNSKENVRNGGNFATNLVAYPKKTPRKSIKLANILPQDSNHTYNNATVAKINKNETPAIFSERKIKSAL